MKKFLALVMVAGICMPAVAQEKKAKTPEEQFAAMDKNGDKKLSKEEYVGAAEGEKKTKKEDRFKALDKNNDGSIDLEEFKAGAKKA
jgi:Ca2+-binding EF-hand superfamily protein